VSATALTLGNIGLHLCSNPPNSGMCWVLVGN
jgi:hypothetical protein